MRSSRHFIVCRIDGRKKRNKQDKCPISNIVKYVSERLIEKGYVSKQKPYDNWLTASMQIST